MAEYLATIEQMSKSVTQQLDETQHRLLGEHDAGVLAKERDRLGQCVELLKNMRDQLTRARQLHTPLPGADAHMQTIEHSLIEPQQERVDNLMAQLPHRVELLNAKTDNLKQLTERTKQLEDKTAAATQVTPVQKDEKKSKKKQKSVDAEPVKLNYDALQVS
jgi:hypothetical protein